MGNLGHHLLREGSGELYGIDSIDQILETYACRISTWRWPVVAVFLLMLDVVALNARVILSEGISGQLSDKKDGEDKPSFVSSA